MMTKIEQAKTYWRGNLAEPPPEPRLPWDAERPPVPSYLRESVSVKVEAGAWGSLREFTARLGAPLEAGLLAALHILLFRYTGQLDFIVGTLVTPSAGPDHHQQLVPLRTRLSAQSQGQELVLQIAASLREASEHLDWPRAALSELLEPRPAIPGEGLFHVALLMAPTKALDTTSSPGRGADAEHLTSCPQVWRACEAADGLTLDCEFDAERLTRATVQRMAGHLARVVGALAAEPGITLDRLNLLSSDELRQLLVEWNATETAIPPGVCIHQLIEAQAARTPEAVALVCRDGQLTYAELNARANQVASRLVKLGVGPDVIVGLHSKRSLEMVVGLLGILKAGGAYLPMDPAYPPERLALLIEDARPKVLLTQEPLKAGLPEGGPLVVRLDVQGVTFASEPAENVARDVAPQHLAYVIYTSGSTGKPKGVMVEHRNVINFFVGMDARIPYQPGSTWLAVTSPSFDISVLELLWTLARGFKVVLFAGEETKPPSGPRHSPAPARAMEFSLFYFSSGQSDGPGGSYRLLTEGARFADERGFVAVWTPERHFHEFGGLFPNPAVTSAALAMITRRVQIRSGSVVAPLHSPIRIAEEWAMVDNLSQGRVAISFASGWMPEDFVISPESYPERKEIMFRQIDIVRRLWRGERVPLPGPLGKDVPVQVLPRPVQSELPLWLTAAGNPETFQMAGRLGMNLLTHLLGQSLEEVSRKVALYRQAWREAGHAGRGHVTLMLHTFVGDSLESVKALVRAPLMEYLRHSADLIKGYTWAFSAFKHRAQAKGEADFSTLPREEMDAILEHAFHRYFETSGLFGTPESCLQRIEVLQANDIDETACLIDFGINPDVVLEHLKHLDRLRQRATRAGESAAQDDLIPALIERHGVTHLQCTPSLAGMLVLDERMQSALSRLQGLLIGGEAFPATLVRQLRKFFRGVLLNMYGPTETTIWSSTYSMPGEPGRISVGRPIANTQMYIVDQNLLPVPVGAVGELLIGGAGVARGYLGRPELTAERFVPSPFQQNKANRLYRTGDLARYLPDGNIELLGRMDHQIKIRGHRVELGEIEALLNEHPAVRASVVIAKEASDGHKQLVAYVIPRPGQSPSQNQLRRYAQDKLPEYMVPSKVVFLTAFPQTPNKKIDRQALPVPLAGPEPSEPEADRPLTAVEKALARLWRELLGLPHIGRHDSFFEAGGDSLLAMQLAAWVREHYHVHLPLRSLFANPTVAGLAEVVESLACSVPASPRLEPAGEREEVEI